MDKSKKLKKKLEKLNRKLYDNNKHITREEFLIHKLSKRIKMYYDNISEDRQKAFIAYIIKQNDFENLNRLEKINKSPNKDALCSKKCKSVSQLIDQIKKEKKRKNNRNVLQTKEGLLIILNPEAYDHTLLGKKKYRKYLKKVAEKEKENVPIELDCTLKNFRKELLKNDNVNQIVMDSFYNKFGYYYHYKS